MFKGPQNKKYHILKKITYVGLTNTYKNFFVLGLKRLLKKNFKK